MDIKSINMYEANNDFVIQVGDEHLRVRVFNHTHVWVIPFKRSGKVVYNGDNWGTVQHIGSLRPRLRMKALRCIRKYYQSKTQQS